MAEAPDQGRVKICAKLEDTNIDILTPIYEPVVQISTKQGQID